MRRNQDLEDVAQDWELPPGVTPMGVTPEQEPPALPAMTVTPDKTATGKKTEFIAKQNWNDNKSDGQFGTDDGTQQIDIYKPRGEPSALNAAINKSWQEFVDPDSNIQVYDFSTDTMRSADGKPAHNVKQKSLFDVNSVPHFDADNTQQEALVDNQRDLEVMRQIVKDYGGNPDDVPEGATLDMWRTLSGYNGVDPMKALKYSDYENRAGVRDALAWGLANNGSDDAIKQYATNYDDAHRNQAGWLYKTTGLTTGDLFKAAFVVGGGYLALNGGIGALAAGESAGATGFSGAVGADSASKAVLLSDVGYTGAAASGGAPAFNFAVPGMVDTTAGMAEALGSSTPTTAMTGGGSLTKAALYGDAGYGATAADVTATGDSVTKQALYGNMGYTGSETLPFDWKSGMKGLSKLSKLSGTKQQQVAQTGQGGGQQQSNPALMALMGRDPFGAASGTVTRVVDGMVNTYDAAGNLLASVDAKEQE